jgi:hypothetical protein
MRKIQMLGGALVAFVALSAIMAASASALTLAPAEWLLSGSGVGEQIGVKRKANSYSKTS